MEDITKMFRIGGISWHTFAKKRFEEFDFSENQTLE